MSGAKRIQRKRTKGWRMPEGAVYVGRPTRWGNPFSVERVPNWPQWAGMAPWQIVTPDGKVWPHEESRKPIVGRHAADRARHADAIRGAVDLFGLHTGPMGNYEYDDDALAQLRSELAGRDLACWCPLEQPCHADVLLEIAAATLSPVSPAPVTFRAADEHDDRPGARCKREPGRSASTT